MWTVLKVTENDKIVAYNYLNFGEEKEHAFGLVDLHIDSSAGKPLITFDRVKALDQSNETSTSREFNVVYTDYATHLVGETCVEDPDTDSHHLALSVWTRDK